MSKSCSFYLGPAVDLDSRRVRVWERVGNGRDLVTDQTLAGTAEEFTVTLLDDRLYEISLVDERDGVSYGEQLVTFETGSTPASGRPRLMSFEDVSESSQSTATSVSSSTSTSQTSTRSATSLSSQSSSQTTSQSSTRSWTSASSSTSSQSSSSSSSQTNSSSSSSASSSTRI